MIVRHEQISKWIKGQRSPMDQWTNEYIAFRSRLSGRFQGLLPCFLTFIKDRFYAPLERALLCILLILIEICNLQNACLAWKVKKTAWCPWLLASAVIKISCAPICEPLYLYATHTFLTPVLLPDTSFGQLRGRLCATRCIALLSYRFLFIGG